MKVLMVGATGKFASMVLPELKKRSVIVRALIRDESKSTLTKSLGADEIAIGDLDDPASLREAAAGVDGVFHIGPGFSPNEAEQGVAMVEAATSAGVQRFVFSGVIHPSISKMVNHRAKQPVEEALFESGLNFTILQPTMFMQNLEASWKGILAEGKFALPYSVEKKASYVDYRDVAEVAALAFTSDALAFGTFELCAPGMLNRIEFAALMTHALGRTIEAAEIPFDDFAQKAHLPEGPLREGIKRMYADYNEFGFPGGNALVLQAILHRPPRTIEQYLAELAAQEHASPGK